ncbi:MAG: winged helix-turn-helix domain-containing protein [Bacteroidales bacterium]|nr:winged helix-turn-helix domain-containing protein [Bacteroidales bacterium]
MNKFTLCLHKTKLTVMIPDPQSIMLPYLKVLADSKEWSFQDLIETLAHTFKVSHNERQEMIPSGQKIFNYRVGFSRTFLKKAGLVESTRYGYVRVTQKGLKILAKNPDYIDMRFLKQINKFIAI